MGISEYILGKDVLVNIRLDLRHKRWLLTRVEPH
jgi:hypothetical protein